VRTSGGEGAENGKGYKEKDDKGERENEGKIRGRERVRREETRG